jgi:hypothetical protein
LERHFVAMRSRRQKSVLTFLAQDVDGRAFCYSNADLRKGEESEEIFHFIDFWKRTHGTLPRHLVFDSKLTTQANLVRLDKMGIAFMTLRARSPSLTREIALVPSSAWREVELDVPTRKFRFPKVHDTKVRIAGGEFRQMVIKDLGHEQPTVLLTNDHKTSAAKVITRYAKRMLIENALSDAVRFFHVDALSSRIGLRIDLDLQITLMASSLYRLLAEKVGGLYRRAEAKTVFHQLLDVSAEVSVEPERVSVTLHKRCHNPYLVASRLADEPTPMPWFGNKLLFLRFAGTAGAPS